MSDYQPPRDILEVLQKIEFEEALEPDDPRRVDTREARGSQNTLDRLARKLGLLRETERFLPLSQKHMLFFGHVGAGKTTELKFYGQCLELSGSLFPVEVDVPAVLDRNNLQYADLLMAMANALLKALADKDIVLPGRAAAPLESWFDEKVAKREEVREFTNEIRAGLQAEVGVPLLTKLFASFTSAFKANATYKDELRRVIRNTFTQLAEAFNRFLKDAEETLTVVGGKAVRVVFFIDGTDKLREEDRRRLFVEDAVLLLAVETLAVYTAPIALKYEGGLVGQLDADLVLPMIKLEDQDGARCDAGWRTLRDLLLRRADRSLFESEREVEALIEKNGGHPRELLRLLQLCCEFAGLKIGADVVVKAVAQLASEYRRLLEPDDYPRLVEIDRSPLDVGNDDRTKHLLYNLAVLEYNDGSWRRSHPVIRTLEGYRRAAAAAPAAV